VFAAIPRFETPIIWAVFGAGVHELHEAECVVPLPDHRLMSHCRLRRYELSASLLLLCHP
jgi:hypothetical protein